MANSRKRFSPRETWLVKSYIRRKLLLDPSWPCDEHPSGGTASSDFEKIEIEDSQSGIQSWCEKWLNEEQWKQLLVALRAKRKRENDQVRKRNITLDNKAWRILSTLAKRDKVTMSQFLISRFEREYLDMDDSEI
ncbi:hypothetical protein JWG42_14245 [Desulfoprunum benzoelyticum]|uniref:Uncharacterized protein n=1 Tax=Desulfoprunum benzoelyticum TaxID=1506996 RepID=A0A840V1M3_9BACT|nr:hypothetical protein [Desulfoprunum benzoelyticum]MBB5349564.1 hypothetical protein [Desulfoprunum benzoelyticum]MBM9531317.1 hypothetical protein [Desulfoprunum benzoelyticum]